MQLLYCEYKFEMVPIIVGCFGNVCKNLNTFKTNWIERERNEYVDSN